MRKFKKRYLLFIPVFVILVGIIGIFLNKNPELKGTYYLTVKNPANHTISLDKNEYITVNGDSGVLVRDGEKKQIQIDKTEKRMTIDGKTIPINYTVDMLNLIEDKSKDPFGKEYVNTKSELFSDYEEGKVTYKD